MQWETSERVLIIMRIAIGRIELGKGYSVRE
jgi:hypothetical protein